MKCLKQETCGKYTLTKTADDDIILHNHDTKETVHIFKDYWKIVFKRIEDNAEKILNEVYAETEKNEPKI